MNMVRKEKHEAYSRRRKKPAREDNSWTCTNVVEFSRMEMLTKLYLMIGGGNIGDAGEPNAVRADKDVVPESAVRQSVDGDHHTGRGGAANVQVSQKPAADGSAPQHISLADKLKNKLFGKKA